MSAKNASGGFLGNEAKLKYFQITLSSSSSTFYHEQYDFYVVVLESID